VEIAPGSPGRLDQGPGLLVDKNGAPFDARFRLEKRALFDGARVRVDDSAFLGVGRQEDEKDEEPARREQPERTRWAA
jgi:hypothetical protein